LKKILFVFLLIILPGVIFSQISYEDYFTKESLRFDYSHSGNSESSNIYFVDLKKEPFWGGTKKNLIDKFNSGAYKVSVFDSASGKLIYSRGFSSLFDEWQKTPEAKFLARSFYETVTVPFPQKTVKLIIEVRNKKLEFYKQIEIFVNPKNYFINPEVAKYPSDRITNNNSKGEKIDIVFIPEGYTKDEMEKFKSDAERFSKFLTKYSPFKENEDKFNYSRVYAPSEESGTDIPGKGIYKRTIMNSHFYTFDIERYIMTFDVKSIRDIAGEVPYDFIVILVNSNTYGGGAVYNDYSMFTSGNEYAELTMVHEFGHLFGGLADEYTSEDDANESMYDLTIEPYDPNITTLVNFESKWKNLVDADTPIPTPNSKEYYGKIGAFEGAGYATKGIYRPAYDCMMRSYDTKKFCTVCSNTLTAMIKFHTDE
jgi:hypothetical protein